MHCETSSRPVIDLTKHKHPRAVHVEVLRFIKGIRGPRANSVSRKQIGDWMRRTPAEAVDAALVDLVAEGKVSSGFMSLRRGNTHKRAVGYEVVKDRPVQCDNCPQLAECTEYGCVRDVGIRGMGR